MIRAVGIFLLIPVLVQAFRIVNDSGLLRDLKFVDDAPCQKLAGPVGAEDITVDADLGIAFIGADDRRAYLLDGDQQNAPNGSIWSLDLNDPAAKPVKLSVDIEGVFHPHGIYLFRVGDLRELYVINHRSPTAHEIDVFTIVSPAELKLRRRISFPQLISPNDLAVVGQDAFFVTNDHGFPRHTLMEKVEDYLGLPLADVVYFDGDQGQQVIDGLRYPNGIVLSDSQQFLYVAETTGRKIKRFRRGNDMTDWHFDQAIDVDSGVDNLEWDSEGRLLTAAHPKPFDFMQHMHNAAHLSPSEVIRIHVDGRKMRSETIWLDSGSEISGSSVAATYEGTLLIGSVFEPHILRCELSE